MILRWSKQFPANFQSFYIADVRLLEIQSGNRWRMKSLTCARAGAVNFKIASSSLMTYCDTRNLHITVVYVEDERKSSHVRLLYFIFKLSLSTIHWGYGYPSFLDWYGHFDLTKLITCTCMCFNLAGNHLKLHKQVPEFWFDITL